MQYIIKKESPQFEDFLFGWLQIGYSCFWTGVMDGRMVGTWMYAPDLRTIGEIFLQPTHQTFPFPGFSTLKTHEILLPFPNAANMSEPVFETSGMQQINQ